MSEAQYWKELRIGDVDADDGAFMEEWSHMIETLHWWVYREIARLRAENAELRAEIARRDMETAKGEA